MPVKTLLALAQAPRTRTGILEELQAGGDFPDVDLRTACQADWLYVLQYRLSCAADSARRLGGEDGKYRHRLLRNSLADIIATCQAWDKQLRKS